MFSIPVYINDVDLIMELLTLLIKFADNTKVANIIRTAEDARRLQECLDTLMEWAAKWGMAFHYRDRWTFVRLYKLYVRPHLEFAAPAWSPWTIQDKECL